MERKGSLVSARIGRLGKLRHRMSHTDLVLSVLEMGGLQFITYKYIGVVAIRHDALQLRIT